jgi:hypothetical protein
MKIEPKYVTFEQAKLLKEKGFKYYCPISYWKQELTYNTPGYPLENGETSQENYYDFERYYAPEQHIVVEWLRIKHGIWVVVNIGSARNGYYATYTKVTELGMDSIRIGDYNLQSPQEAYSSAFDYILKELI